GDPPVLHREDGHREKVRLASSAGLFPPRTPRRRSWLVIRRGGSLFRNHLAKKLFRDFSEAVDMGQLPTKRWPLVRGDSAIIEQGNQAGDCLEPAERDLSRRFLRVTRLGAVERAPPAPLWVCTPRPVEEQCLDAPRCRNSSVQGGGEVV